MLYKFEFHTSSTMNKMNRLQDLQLWLSQRRKVER